MVTSDDSSLRHDLRVCTTVVLYSRGVVAAMVTSWSARCRYHCQLPLVFRFAANVLLFVCVVADATMSTDVPSVTEADGVNAFFPTTPRNSRPLFRLHYSVFYNVSLPTPRTPTLLNSSSSSGRHQGDAGPVTLVPDAVLKVSNDCAKLYARTFLENLLSVETWLRDLCTADTSTMMRRAIRVRVHPVVLVTVFGVMVKIDTDLNVTSVINDQVPTHRSSAPPDVAAVAIEACAVILNTTFHRNVSHFDDKLRETANAESLPVFDDDEDVDDTMESGTGRPVKGPRWRWRRQPLRHTRKLTTIDDESGVCEQAAMRPPGFVFRSAEWFCPEDLELDRRLWLCTTSDSQIGVKSSTAATFAATAAAKQKTSTSATTTSSSTVSNDVTETVTVTLVPDSKTTVYNSSPGPPKLWGVQTIRNISRIYVTEGDRPFDLGLKVWYNRSALCGEHTSECDISLEFAFTDTSSTDSPDPVCRLTDKPITQLVLGQPSLWPSFASDEPHRDIDYCRMRLATDVFGDEVTAATSESTALGHVTGSIFVKATTDHKYDGTQVRNLIVSMSRRFVDASKEENITEILLQLPVFVEDRDRKSTCQSVNDPHVTTFDGLEYNNFQEGEFVLYRHKTLPFSVHVVYQKCQSDVTATCNCAIAVRSGDDVIVIDRCARRQHAFPPPVGGLSDDYPPIMTVRLILNGRLTPGTSVFQDADGKRYFVHMPHGTYAKVIVSGPLINIWVVPSSVDFYMTEGLCGVYDGQHSNDLHWKNGSTINDPTIPSTPLSNHERLHPADFINDWRVDMEGDDSLLDGVDAALRPHETPTYCRCTQHQAKSQCGVAMDVDRCDLQQGKNITEQLIARAVKSASNRLQRRRRRKRGIADNSIETDFNDVSNIDIDHKSKPPAKYKWKSPWNEATAKQFCRNYIKDDYSIGRLCTQIPSVNFRQEITTCVEDIQITGNTSWADSARDAMKEQCREEAQKNTTLPRHLVDRVVNELCISDCSRNGVCRNGVCECYSGFVSADCSIRTVDDSIPAPEMFVASRYGLCDTRTMNCSHVIVYGDHFVDSPNLTCHYQAAQVTESRYIPLGILSTRRAEFISFSAVECAVPMIRSYLISISNNGINPSQPLLFIPFDSVCTSCHIFNTSCAKIRNNCIIDGVCYREGESCPNDPCLICRAYNDEYQWTTLIGDQCHPGGWWGDIVHLPDWIVAVAAAIGGSMVGVGIGFLLYKCCCRRKKLESIDTEEYSDDFDSGVVQTVRGGLDGSHLFAVPRPPSSTTEADDSILHRNWNLPVTATGGGGSVLGVGFPSTAGFVTCSISDLVNLELPPSPVQRLLQSTTMNNTTSTSSSSSRSRSHDSPDSNILFADAVSSSDGENLGIDNLLDSTTYF